MNFQTRIQNYINASFAAIAVQTTEESRAMRDILAVAAATKRPVYLWSCTEGLKAYTFNSKGEQVLLQAYPGLEMLEPCLAQLCTMAESAAAELARATSKGYAPNPNPKAQLASALVVLRDPHLFSLDSDPTLPRRFRDLFTLAPTVGAPVIILAPEYTPHPTFARAVTVLDYNLPSPSDLREICEQVRASALESGVPAADVEITDELVRALGGLSTAEAANALALCTVEEGKFDPAIVYREKVLAVKRSGLLEVIEPDPRGLDAIGGFDLLKPYIQRRRDMFTDEAREFGLPDPKGVLLLGVPGCLHGDTPIADPVDGTLLSVRARCERGESFHVWALTSDGGRVVASALPPQKYPPAPMMRLKFSHGDEITVTPAHRLWDGQEWIFASEAARRLRESGACHLPTSSGTDLSVHGAGVHHSMQTVEGSPDGCHSDHRSCGEQLPLSAGTDRERLQAPDDAPERTPSDRLQLPQQTDGQERRPEHNHQGQEPGLPSTPSFSDLSAEAGLPAHEGSVTPVPGMFAAPPQSPPEASRSGTSEPPARGVRVSRSTAESSVAGLPPLDTIRGTALGLGYRCLPPAGHGRESQASYGAQPLPEQVCARAPRAPTQPADARGATDPVWTSLTSVEYLGEESYYDFHVPVYNNYAAAGVWNHNTGKSLAAKTFGTALRCPVLKLDIGKVFGSLVGESERLIRDTTELAEAISPCVLWVN